MIKKAIAGVLLFYYSCGIPDRENTFKKYDVHSGKIEYTCTHFLKSEPLNYTLYFSDYGATECFDFSETSNKHKLHSILKQDSIQFDRVLDSFAIKHERIADFLIEMCVFNRNSRLYSETFEFNKKKDTTYLGRTCELYNISIKPTSQKGIAVVWRNIPLYVESQTEGLSEKFEATNIYSDIKMYSDKLKLPFYVEY